MGAPLVAAAVIAVIGGLVQVYNSEKARGANAKILKDLKKAFADIVPPEYDISIDSPPDFIKQTLAPANLDFSRLTPESYKIVGHYSPKAAKYIAETNPTLFKGSENFKEGRQSQIDALRSMKKEASGESPELKIMMDRASQQSQSDAQSRQQSIMDSAQRRGMGGSGLSFAAAMQSGSDSMNRGAMQGQNAALSAYREKMAAIRESGSMGRQLAGDEQSIEEQNAQIINDFNMRTSRNYQDWQNRRTDIENEGQRFNLDRNQRTADMNVSQNNEYDQWNLNNRNKLSQQQYDNNRGERNYQDEIAYKKAEWASKEKARQNDLRSRGYNDTLNKSRSQQGLAGIEMGQNNQNAADRNQAVSGISGAASGYYQGEAQRESQREAWDREDQRRDKYWKARYGRPKKTASGYDDDDDDWNMG